MHYESMPLSTFGAVWEFGIWDGDWECQIFEICIAILIIHISQRYC
jgi:hypothetical protein